MLELPLRAKLLVAGSIARAALIWAVPCVAVVSSPWILGNAIDDLEIDDFRLRVLVAMLVVPFVLTTGFILLFPTERYGDFVTARLRRHGGVASGRSVNLAEQLGLATGTYRHTVMSIASDIPNVAAIPGRAGTTVVVTTGAERTLPRDDLEALMATQIVVASDPWVRVASTSQLLAAPRFALLFSAGFLNPLLIPLCFLAFFGHRRGDMVRDMVADAAALRATRHPEPLARALYELRPAALIAHRLEVGLPGFLVDQYWVMSRRVTVTTTVSGMGPTRQWTTADEIAAEMAMRSDRILRGSRGELDALFDVTAWKRAVRGLGDPGAVTPAGLPIALSPPERALAEHPQAATPPPPPSPPPPPARRGKQRPKAR